MQEEINSLKSILNNKLDSEKVTNSTTVTEAGYSLDARQANAGISGTMANQIKSNKNLIDTNTQNINSLDTSLSKRISWTNVLTSNSTTSVPLANYRELILVLNSGAYILTNRSNIFTSNGSWVQFVNNNEFRIRTFTITPNGNSFSCSGTRTVMAFNTGSGLLTSIYQMNESFTIEAIYVQ